MPTDMRALVLDGHSRAAVEVVQSLGSRGISVDVAAEHEDAAGFRSRYTAECLRQPTDPASLVDWLNDLVSRKDFTLLVPATENSLQAFRAMGDSSPLWDKAVLPPPAALETALSKQKTWLLAAEIGVPVPRSRLIEQGEPIPSEGFPAVLKPLYSVVSKGNHTFRLEPRIVRSEEERRRHLTALLAHASVQEQQYVEGRGVGVECLYARGKLIWSFVHERVHELPLTGGGSTYRKSIAPDALLVSAAQMLLDALGWHGAAMVEFKRAADGSFYLMEINPRLWGSLALAIDAGVDFPWGLWLIATGRQPGPQPAYRYPYYTRYLPGDVDWMKENLKADHSDPLLLTRPIMRSVVEYFRPLAGLESWDHFRWRDPTIVLLQLQQVVKNNIRSVLGQVKRRWKIGSLCRQHSSTLRRLQRQGEAARVILFVCYGNICRSPFAEQYARKKMPGWEVLSAGFHEEDGRSSPEHLLAAATEFGVDLAVHRSQRLDVSMVERADLIVLMDLQNFESLAVAFPAAVSKVACLGLFSPQPRPEIADPYLFSGDRTAKVLGQIVEGVDGILEFARGLQRQPEPALQDDREAKCSEMD